MSYIEDLERDWAQQASDDRWLEAMEHTDAPEPFDHECHGCDECLISLTYR